MDSKNISGQLAFSLYATFSKKVTKSQQSNVQTTLLKMVGKMHCDLALLSC